MPTHRELVDLTLGQSFTYGPSRGEYAIGLAAAAGPMVVWLVARDQPPRGGVGLSAATHAVRVAAEVEGHPVLGETARMSLGLGGGR